MNAMPASATLMNCNKIKSINLCSMPAIYCTYIRVFKLYSMYVYCWHAALFTRIDLNKEAIS